MKTVLDSFRFRAHAIALGVACWYVIELTALLVLFPPDLSWRLGA